MADRVGQQLGNYHLLRLLGSGGFADVYLGEHIYLKRQVAVKVLHLHLIQQEFPSFLQEAQTIAHLNHTNIIPVFDFGIDGTPFLVMEYMPLGSLRNRYPLGALVTLQTIVSYVRQIADALQCAHDVRVIHRDVKPANMLIRRNDQIVLSDFGIATAAHRTASLQALNVSGSPFYMAPEQIDGKPRPASDQYGLAMVVYEWLCGKPAFQGEPLAVMYKQTYAPVPSLREQMPTVEPGVERVVLKALAKDSQQRFSNIQAFAMAFEQACQVDIPPSLPTSRPVSHPAKRSMELSTSPGESVIQTEPITPQDRSVISIKQSTPPGQTSIPTERPALPSLEVSSTISHETARCLLSKPIINIGRDPSNEIVINSPVISAFHLQLVEVDNQFVIVHPQSSRQSTTNGLLYLGRHIEGNQPFRKQLARGDIFRIGDEHGTLITLAYNDGSGTPQNIVPGIHPIPLGVPIITIGRSPDNMVVLNHPQVSGHHARLEQVQGGYRIVDPGSTHLVYVNAQQVKEKLLNPGDEIRIGPVKLTYTGTQLIEYDEAGTVRIDAIHLKKFDNKQRVLLNDVSLTIPARKMVALVGGSGADKSTLMHALSGSQPAQQGFVLYNGQDYYRNLAAFGTQIGYVTQDEIIHKNWTVERILYQLAKKRLPRDFTENQIKMRIDEVIDDVKMEEQRTLPMNKLSPSQRKHIAIAIELLTVPSVLFLDEPTSNLDPSADQKIMFLLRRIADQGCTIILTTFASNNINVCDYICFLAQGGRLAYYGPPNGAREYFGKLDFVEICNILEPTSYNPDIAAEAEARFRVSSDYQRYVIEPLTQNPAS